jgi:proteasome lid subunit RPN8/RPN11
VTRAPRDTECDVSSLRLDALDRVIRHAREAAPNECCGILIGTRECVEQAMPARNASKQPTTRFLVHPQDHFEALRQARRQGLDVVGFYHSHPRSPAVPSERDVLEASYPDYLYLLVSLAHDPPDVRLYLLAEGNFLMLPLVTVR